ncbi:MAG: hypothetical protein SFW08_12460 [Gemmatimonadaceae bacterium]|nr:hypothetical protein [Gemmatimonadaceae bacterium]
MRRPTSRRGALSVRALAMAAFAAVVACSPAAAPLSGTVAPVTAVPPSAKLRDPTLIQFRWEFKEEQLGLRGDGAARLAPPDSARLDLFLEGGFGSGAAFVIGNTITTGLPMADRIIPPAALFWGALGRLAVPPGDTTVRVAGDTVRTEITGAGGSFRAAFVRDSLVVLERIADGRVLERMERRAGAVTYRQFSSRRSLDLTISRRATVAPFDPAIWPR